MKIQLKLIPMAILVAFGWLFAQPASAARRGGNNGGKVGGFNFLPVLAVVCIAAILTACGGGGGGGNSAAAPTVNAPAPPTTMVAHTYRVEYASVAFLPNTPAGLYTIVVGDDYRILRRSDGVSIGSFAPSTVVVPGGTPQLATTPSQLGIFQLPLDSSWASSGVPAGAVASETVYVADFPNFTCSAIRSRAHFGDSTGVRGHTVQCLDSVGNVLSAVPVLKTHQQIYQLCWRDNRRAVTCDIREVGTGYFIGMAFPDQTYRRDDGKCASAPFYAVGNCQSENAVDVGNFAAFVSGLDGGGYRQFGVRHRWNGEDWKAAAMVSHAKGAEFLDTWWGRLRLEHSIFDDAAAFAEYESGITSLRQNGFMFADIPISGGRVGFRLDDFTASFGRPMHYKGKGNNAAAVHWQATKQTGLSFRTHNNNAEVQWQWRREF